MSINQENYPLTGTYDIFSGVSPLYHTLPSFNRFNSDPKRIRTPLQSIINLSHDTEPYIREPSTALPLKSSLLKSSRGRDPRVSCSATLSKQLRRQRLKRTKTQKTIPDKRKLIFPLTREKSESCSSHPSEPVSSLFRNFDSNQAYEMTPGTSKSYENMFNDALYTRANEFLDNECLDIVDPQDYHKVSYSTQRMEVITDDEDGHDRRIEKTLKLEDVRSLTLSPKLITENICCSTLYQRRASRSQEPSEGSSDKDTFNNRRPSKLDTVRRYKDDLNQILMSTSPIEEKDTPVMSTNNSEYQGNTPNGFSSSQILFRSLLSPDPIESKTPEEVKLLIRQTSKCSKKNQDPLFEIKPTQILIEPSPLKSLKQEKVFSPLGFSPIFENLKPEWNQNNDASQSRNGTSVRKSRFQKLRESQE